MAWIPGRFNFFSPDRPGPSLHICSGSPASADFALDGVANTAAATSLTSFINVSGQPQSRKGLTPFSYRKGHALPRLLFSGFPMSAMSRDYGDVGDSSPLPRAAGPRAA